MNLSIPASAPDSKATPPQGTVISNAAIATELEISGFEGLLLPEAAISAVVAPSGALNAETGEALAETPTSDATGKALPPDNALLPENGKTLPVKPVKDELVEPEGTQTVATKPVTQGQSDPRTTLVTQVVASVIARQALPAISTGAAKPAVPAKPVPTTAPQAEVVAAKTIAAPTAIQSMVPKGETLPGDSDEAVSALTQKAEQAQHARRIAEPSGEPAKSSPAKPDAAVETAKPAQPAVSSQGANPLLLTQPGLAESSATKQAPTAAPAETPAPQKFETLVQSLAAAREAAQPGRGDMQLLHREFGHVAMQFEIAGRQLKVALSSGDAEFAPAVQAAMAERPADRGVERPVTTADASAQTRSEHRQDGQQAGGNAALTGGGGQNGSRHSADSHSAASHDGDTTGKPAANDTNPPQSGEPAEHRPGLSSSTGLYA